jgi:hypothetical protein
MRPPHPARLPMKCIGTAVHPLPQGGEGLSFYILPSPARERGESDFRGLAATHPPEKRIFSGCGTTDGIALRATDYGPRTTDD